MRRSARSRSRRTCSSLAMPTNATRIFRACISRPASSSRRRATSCCATAGSIRCSRRRRTTCLGQISRPLRHRRRVPGREDRDRQSRRDRVGGNPLSGDRPRPCAARRGNLRAIRSSEIGSPLATPKAIAKRARAFENIGLCRLRQHRRDRRHDAARSRPPTAIQLVVDYKGQVLAESNSGETFTAFADIDLGRPARPSPQAGHDQHARPPAARTVRRRLCRVGPARQQPGRRTTSRIAIISSAFMNPPSPVSTSIGLI